MIRPDTIVPRLMAAGADLIVSISSAARTLADGQPAPLILLTTCLSCLAKLNALAARHCC
jgi:hypothetical protein